MSKIQVHVLEFLSCGINTHVEIVLQEKRAKREYYYSLNLWSSSAPAASRDEYTFKKLINDALRKISFDIDASMDDIITQWRKYKREHNGDCLFDNCADASIWFLNNFAGMNNYGKCSWPISCDYLCCGLFAPSFLQACTLPGRVMAVTAYNIKHRTSNDRQLETLSMRK